MRISVSQGWMGDGGIEKCQDGLSSLYSAEALRQGFCPLQVYEVLALVAAEQPASADAKREFGSHQSYVGTGPACQS